MKRCGIPNCSFCLNHTLYGVRITGSTDTVWFNNEFEALRVANQVNKKLLKEVDNNEDKPVIATVEMAG